VRIAVVGSGIGGIGSAWLLSGAHRVDVYEAEPQLGGHTCTVDVTPGGTTFPVDTGFMVFNRRTYPNLTRFFEHLGVEAADADMSFSVQVPSEGIEWSSDIPGGIFAQRRNIANPRFLGMLRDIVRLSRDADRLLDDPATAKLTLGELIAREGYGRSFTEWYLVPMGAAIWSTPPGRMLEYPASTFLRFCENHGLLRVMGKPPWLSVRGGARRYLESAGESFSGEVFTAEPVERLERTASGIRVHTPRRTEDYDIAIVATHPPQAAEMLGETMTPDERAVLSAFQYWPNDIIVHTDESFLPKSPRAWASWNWYSSASDVNASSIVLTYRLNTLQSLPPDAPTVMVTLNRNREVRQGAILREMVFDHPMYSAEAVAAQRMLPRIQGTDRLWFTGAWTRYGFHEDGLLSAVIVAESLGIKIPWGDDLDPSRTMVREGAPVPMLGQTRKLFPEEAAPVWIPGTPGGLRE